MASSSRLDPFAGPEADNDKYPSSYRSFVGTDLKELRDKINSNRRPFGLLFQVDASPSYRPSVVSGDGVPPGDRALDPFHPSSHGSLTINKRQKTIPNHHSSRQQTHPSPRRSSRINHPLDRNWRMYEEKDGEESVLPLDRNSVEFFDNEPDIGPSSSRLALGEEDGKENISTTKQQQQRWPERLSAGMTQASE